MRWTQQTHFQISFPIEWFIQYFHECANFSCLLGFISNFIMFECKIKQLSETNTTNTFLKRVFQIFHLMFSWMSKLFMSLRFLSKFILFGCQIKRLSKTNATNTFLNVFSKWFIQYFYEWANISCLLGFLSNFIIVQTPFPNGLFNIFINEQIFNVS